MTDYEKLGQFYLGKTHDLKTGVTSPDDLVMYDAKDLTTHAVCVGMTGSGKTGLCLSLLEEAAIDGIPAICIDPKGDLGNLMLTFPNLAPQDFAPWVDPVEATRQGLTVPEMARKTAELWKRGLGEWGQSGERIQRFREAAEVAIYTPASTAGRPLTVLKSFAAPNAQVRENSEAFRDNILSAVSGLLALMQIDGDPISSREHILLSTILDFYWREGQDVDMATLIRSIQAPPFQKVGFLDLESFYPSGDRFKLAMSLNSLLASPSFAAWMEGESLDIQNLLYTAEGKPRLAIISIAHLTDSERMFFVTILLNEMISWMRSQPGTSSLRALLYMDEVFGYFPPTANPPSKRPMLTLLKQARAYGLGCVLATQNPVDLDYKGLSNCGTWFLGRLQTERDKMRVLEGLEGAAASTGSEFDRASMEQTLAALGSRVFLMNNVHESGHVIFRTRWALSYLRGPITRDQIEILMAPLKAGDSSSGGSSAFAAPATELANDDARPVLPPEIPEYFMPIRRSVEKVVYRPALLGQARVHYVDSKTDIDQWDEVTLLRLAGDGVDRDAWSEAEEWDEAELPELTALPDEPDAAFRDLPSELMQKKSYSAWETSLKNHLFRNQKLMINVCPILKEASRPGESESDFRIRLRHAAREQRDLLVEKLRAKYASRFRTIEDQIRRAEQKIETEKSQSSQKKLSTVVSIGSSVLGALFGRKLTSSTNMTRAGSAIRSASSLAKEAEDIRHAEEAYEAVVRKREELSAQVESEAQAIQDQFDPDLMEFQHAEITPRKSDMSIMRVVLVWLPYGVTRTGETERIF
ncbi:MAG: ATP-binding protein [Planctomycetaceae bacterium]